MRDPVVNADSGRFSRTWTNYIDDLNSAVATLASAPGVTNGSDAAPGAIGEFMMTIGASGVPLGSAGVPTNVATLDLTPGDWDLAGNVAFNTTGATGAVAAGVNATSATFGDIFTHISGSLGSGVSQRLGTGGSQRINITLVTTVYLVASATLSSGAATATGRIWARRVR